MIGQAIADGLLSGAIVGLGAIGVSLGMQILRFANFSHSELLTWGAYLALTFISFVTMGQSIGRAQADLSRPRSRQLVPLTTPRIDFAPCAR